MASGYEALMNASSEAPKPKRAPSGALVTLLIIAVLGLVRLKCGGPSEAELAIEAARQRNDDVGKSLLTPPPAKP